MPLTVSKNNSLLSLLAKHKIIGNPITLEGEEPSTKEEAILQLEKSDFFRDIRKCEALGVCIGYDEFVKYSTVINTNPKEENKEIEHLLRVILQDSLHSYYLTVSENNYYLYIRYTQMIHEKIRAGPLLTAAKKKTEEVIEYKKLWGDKTEYRKFANGQIRICVSLEAIAEHSIPYFILSRIFSLRAEGGVIESNMAKRKGVLLNPVISIESFMHSYNSLNKLFRMDYLKKMIDNIREIVPIKIQGAYFTSSMYRGTRAYSGGRSPVYLCLGKGHRWPVEDKDLFTSAIIALNGVLGKIIEQKHTVEGLSEAHTLYATVRGEDLEFIFDIEEEYSMNIEKYNLMRFRIAYEDFFSEIVAEQKLFPKICVQVKYFLHAHGLYPHHLTDKAVELLCFRTAYKANTISAGFRAAISTQYSYGYTIDIRKGKVKMKPKESGKISVTHSSGCFSLDLPEKKVFDRMNKLFLSALSVLEKNSGIDKNMLPTNVFQGIFSPSMGDADFSLSNTPYQGYTEIDHYNQSLGGCTGADSFSQCFSFLNSINCISYFCKAGRLFVSVPSKENIPLAVGASIMLTGMKYIKRNYKNC